MTSGVQLPKMTFAFACVRLALCNGIAVLELSG